MKWINQLYTLLESVTDGSKDEIGDALIDFMLANSSDEIGSFHNNQC